MYIKNILAIDCNQIEQLAKLGYWEWHKDTNELHVSKNFQNMIDFIAPLDFPLSLVKYLKQNKQYKECSKLICYIKQISSTVIEQPVVFSINTNNNIIHYSCKSDIINNNDKTIISGVIQDVTDNVKYSNLKEKEIKFEKQISQIASRFLERKSFKEDVLKTLQEIGSLLNSSQVVITSIQNNKTQKLYSWKKNSLDTSSHSFIDALPPHETKYFIELLKEKKLVCLNSHNDVPEAAKVVKQYFKKNINASVMLSAITIQNQTTGTLIVAKQDPCKWDFSDIHIVKMTSILLSNALKQNKIQNELSISERRLQFSLLAGNLGTWEYNIEDKKLFVDEKYANIFGYSNNTINRIPNWVYKNIHPKELSKYIEEIDKCFSGEKKYYSLELKIKCLDGSYKWVHDWGIVTKNNDNGHPIVMVGVIQDISKRKRLENQLCRAKTKAENNEKLKTAFLANVSHEIRTPMNGITGFAELLYNNQIAEKDQQKYFKVIWKNSTRLLQLINNILDISRLESNQVILYEREYNINKILDQVERQTNQKLENKNIKISFISKLDNQMAYVKIDDTRLKQVLKNVIDNAIKFTSEGKIDITCKLNNKGDLEFKIKDTGNGIDKTQFKNIFKRFIQTENAIKLNKGGSGLGLPITKGLLCIMNGEIWFESERGVGSTFYISIPYKPTKVNVQNLD